MDNSSTAVSSSSSSTIHHAVALPLPGRGHINPLLNLCKILVSYNTDIVITFVVTEEWLGFIHSDPKPHQIRFRSIPNVVPSDSVRAANMEEFFRAVSTRMEAPFEEVMDGIDLPVSIIIADTLLFWAIGVGKRRDIPVASFFPMSAMMFLMVHHFDDVFGGWKLFRAKYLAKKNEVLEGIPGVSSMHVKDFGPPQNEYISNIVKKAISLESKPQYLLFTSVYELETEVINILRKKFSFPVYTIGPAIPYFELDHNLSFKATKHEDSDYLRWLNNQPSKSVLYVSLGSFVSVSSAQMDELAAGLAKSCVLFFWVARDQASRLKEICGDLGLIVPWCDQLRVLSHPSIGGFWSHCGWNSVQEGIYAGLPFLLFPIVADQFTNSKLVVEDWKIGYRVNGEVGEQSFVTRDEIARLVQKLMDFGSDEGKEMRERARKLKEICQNAILQNGSSAFNMKTFIEDITSCSC